MGSPQLRDQHGAGQIGLLFPSLRWLPCPLSLFLLVSSFISRPLPLAHSPPASLVPEAPAWNAPPPRLCGLLPHCAGPT